MYLLYFLLLHDLQSGWIFEISSVPPFDTGNMWSSVSFISGSCLLQQRHMKLYFSLSSFHCASVCAPPLPNFFILLCLCIINVFSYPPFQFGWFSPQETGGLLPILFCASLNFRLCSSVNIFPIFASLCFFRLSGVCLIPIKEARIFCLVSSDVTKLTPFLLGGILPFKSAFSRIFFLVSCECFSPFNMLEATSGLF